MSDDVDAGVSGVGLRVAAPAARRGRHAYWRPLPGWRIGPAGFGLIRMSLLAFSVGVVAGLGAYVFRELIGLVHNVLFLGKFAFNYDANLFTPASPWGAGVILVPVIGAVVVTFLVVNFAPEAKGHGVPEVMDAIYYGEGKIRPVVALVKSLASAFAIGSGASVGREGPIVQIGSSFGSTLGQLIRMDPAQRIVLIAAGAGAGIAATFNTPIGGVMFAIELMLPEVSVNTFLPVAVATGTATFIGRIFFGTHPSFQVPPIVALPDHAGWAMLIIVLYIVLGGVVGVAAAAYTQGLYALEDWFDRIPNNYLRHCLGMAAVGLLMYGLFHSFGHYFVEGVGYATIQAILTGQLNFAGLLALLFLCKLAATSLSLGSGSSGGIFSPSLFMGATIGAAFAGFVLLIVPGVPVNLPAFAMIGMGAMVGGATGAAMTAVTMIFEMTRDYGIVLPMILAVAVALGVRRMLSRENIYTLKLARRGHTIPKALQANMFLVRKAKEVMERKVLVVPAELGLNAFLLQPDHGTGMQHIVVAKGERIVGVVRINTALRHGIAETGADIAFGDVATRDFTLAREDDVAFDVIKRMWRRHAVMAIVVRSDGVRYRLPRPSDVLGVISKEHVADAVAGSIQVYPR
ncbi:MAG TPA: chloride channel protein [Stellaceae bacterium]|nr:chloride channel protein [Stellaceae bacterium]